MNRKQDRVVLAGAVLLVLAGCGPAGPQRQAADRAEAFIERGETEAALKVYRDAQQAYPDEPVFHHGEGVVLYMLDRSAAAEEAFRRAVEMEPENGEFRLYLGHALAAQKRFEDALVEYGEMSRLEPMDARGWKALGITAYNLKRYPEARAALEKYLAFARDAPDWDSISRLLSSLPREETAD